MKRFLQNQKGLTLVELLAVIVILGIVAAIAVPTVGSIIQKSRVNAVKADAIQVINAAKLYVAEYGVPATTLGITPNSDTTNELADYVDNVTTLQSYQVTVGEGGTTFKITATSASGAAGKYTVQFNNADVTAINGSTATTSGTTITIQ